MKHYYDLFGQWIVSGWAKAYWSAGSYQLHIMIHDVHSPHGLAQVYEFSSSLPITFEQAQDIVQDFRKHNSLVSLMVKVKKNRTSVI